MARRSLTGQSEGRRHRMWEVVPVVELKGLVDNWILLAQGLTGSVGALTLAIGQ
jgi:hypothetical protein